MYTIRLIFVQWHNEYDGQHMPNVVDAWDEYSVEENPGGYQESLSKHEARVGTDYDWVRALDVRIPSHVVEGLGNVPNLKVEWRPVD